MGKVHLVIILITGLLLIIAVQYKLADLSKESYRENIIWNSKQEFVRGFDEGLQYQSGFLEESGSFVHVSKTGNALKLMIDSRELIRNNKYSGYARGMMDGTEYYDMNISSPEWYSAEDYNNKVETIYVHDSKMDNDIKMRYYLAGVMITTGRTDEFSRLPLSIMNTEAKLQDTFYYLGRCQMQKFRQGNIDKYQYYQNGTYLLLNASWDYYQDFGYPKCR
jgi:hypothetical protein